MKILFSYFDQKGEKTEELEVVPIGENLFRIAQIPLNALGISMDDEVEAMIISDENLPEFIRFTKKSGNHTITINKFPSDQAQTKVLQKLDIELCTYIKNKNNLNVNIMQIADLDEIQNFLFLNEVAYQVMNPNPYEGKLVIPF